MRELISQQIERYDPNDPIGFAHLAHIVSRSDRESGIVYHHDGSLHDRIIQSRTPFVYHGGYHPQVPEHRRTDLRDVDMHPLVGEMAKTKLIRHGETISNPHELLTHLAKMASLLPGYRERWKYKRDFESDIEPSVRVNYNRFPKHEQQMIANQYMRVLTHPDFQKDLPEFGKMLSINESGFMHHANPMLKGKFNKLHGSIDWHLPNELHDPSVRHSMHDFLDSYEKQGEHHALVASTIRSRMVDHHDIQAPEIIRMTHKFVANPNSFDFGSHGILGSDTRPLTYDTTQDDVVNIEQAEKMLRHQVGKQKDPRYRIPWLLRPDSDQQRYIRFMKKITNALSTNPARHTRESYLDAASTIHHLVQTHPTFRYMKGNVKFTTDTGTEKVGETNQVEVVKGHMDSIHHGLQTILDSDARRLGQSRNPAEATELIKARAAIKASGVAR